LQAAQQQQQQQQQHNNAWHGCKQCLTDSVLLQLYRQLHAHGLCEKHHSDASALLLLPLLLLLQVSE
jgi:hypothetical protein